MTNPNSESWVQPIFDAVVSDVQRTGFFAKVNEHEPRRAPSTGLTAAVWIQDIAPAVGASSLITTAARLLFNVRIFTSFIGPVPDMVDPKMTAAASNLIRRYHDNFDFDLDSLGVRNVDLLGEFGVPLGCTFGYMEQDKKLFRIATLNVPVIVNDVWTQVK